MPYQLVYLFARFGLILRPHPVFAIRMPARLKPICSDAVLTALRLSRRGIAIKGLMSIDNARFTQSFRCHHANSLFHGIKFLTAAQRARIPGTGRGSANHRRNWVILST